ncbi:MAG: NAD(P)-dependent oxidoreductase, partial [Pseudomonadota bacterium]
MTGAPKVLLHTKDGEVAQRILQARHPDIEPVLCDSYAALAGVVAEHQPEVVFSNRFDPRPYPREAVIGPASVRWVSNGGSGVNHLMPWDPAAVTVTNSAGVAAGAMAEYALGAFLHFAMDVPGMVRDQAARHWDMGRVMRPLAGAVLLIVGLGKTGSRMAALGDGLGMEVIGMRARPQPTPHVGQV